MKRFFARVASFVLFSSLTFINPPKLLASKDKDDDAREVYLAYVQGDVRISAGKDHRPDLNQPWEQALSGDRISQGYALATGNGRAEIEFEDGSTVYLAENSLMLFRELRAPGDRVVSSMSLPTGTATFALQPALKESFFIETPTDRLEVSPPEASFVRIDAYLDSMAITPQGEKGEPLVWPDGSRVQLLKGKAVFLQGGGIITPPDHSVGVPTSPTEAGPLGIDPLLQSMPDFQLPSMAPFLNQESARRSTPENAQFSSLAEWDAWVSRRQAYRDAVTGVALKASGLSSPIPHLADFYEHGTFFRCEPYGTCWEAADSAEPQDSTPQSAAPISQSPAQAQVNPRFQPQPVQWEELVQGWCSPGTFRTVTRVAITPEELQKLEQRKVAAQKARYSPGAYPISCENGYWIPYRRHFARVLTPQLPHHCEGAKCKPIHAPRPVWVKVGNKVGFVPAHPKDVKGKPPVNLKEGILVPPSKPGERTERVAVEPSQKVTVFDKTPREFRGEALGQGLRVPAPEIQAHLVETARESSVAPSAHAAPPITYDYKSHHFVMPASVVAGTKPGSREVPVGGIDSHGKVGSFADGHSHAYAESFARSETAASYRGGSYSAGAHGSYGSGYSSGGNYGYSSGSYSSGSHSFSSGSSGGSYSHSSGGGWSSGSSSGSSGGGPSSSSSSSSSGGARGRP